MVQHGAAQCTMVPARSCTPLCCMVHHGFAQYTVMLHGVARRCTVHHDGAARCCTVHCGVLWSTVVQHDVARCTTAWHGTAPLPGALWPNHPLFGLQVPSTQLFPSAERPYGPEGNATLPPDWKHLGAPALGPRGKGGWGGGSSQGPGGDLGWSRVPSLLKTHQEGAGVGWVVTPNLSPYRGAAGPELQLQLQLQPGEVQ